MKFETRYLIRWGIPGWVFLLHILLFYFINHSDKFTKLIEDPIKILGFIVAIAGIGVPVGYLFHQLYFCIFWVLSKTKGVESITSNIKNYKRKYPDDNFLEYFHLEYLWQSELSLFEQSKRDYLADRYRHLLSTTHSLGVLSTSLFCSIIISFFIISDMNVLIREKALYIVIEVFALAVTFFNYLYYSDKTMNFQGKFLNEFLNDKARNDERKKLA